MSNPQQPELARSRKTPAQDQDAVAAVVDGQRLPGEGGPGGPVPAENQPGHHPAKEQDKPDLDDFAAKLGVTEGAETADDASGRQTPIGKRTTLVAAAGALATVLALVLAVVMVGRRRRSRR